MAEAAFRRRHDDLHAEQDASGRVISEHGVSDRSNSDQLNQRVVVVDDHALLAESVVMTLRVSGMEASSLPVSTPDLGDALLKLQPNLVLLDLFLNETPDPSLAILERLAAVNVAVLIVTATSDAVLHARCMRAGAVGVVEKSVPIEQLIAAVQRALRHEPVMSNARLADLRQAADAAVRSAAVKSPFDALTRREREVFEAITLGHAAARIARDQQISLVTVRTHIRSVLYKLDCHSQLEAVTLATRHHWFP
jgi:DNA-binding NarL/FixJ family response regulator